MCSVLTAGVAGMSNGAVAAGVIWSIALGFAAGNYACSLVHRLPRKKSILEHKPYCGECGHPLATADLFPVVSALMLKHTCRYCGVKFPTSHTWTEILIGLLFVSCFFLFNFSENYMLVTAIGTFLITLACIDVNDDKIQRSPMIALMVMGMLYRTLNDGNLYGFLPGGLYGMMAGALIWRKQITRENHVYVLPEKAKLLAVCGIVVGGANLTYVLPLFGIFTLLGWVWMKAGKYKRLPVTIPLGLATMVPVFFPHINPIVLAYLFIP
jgi:prepilin signal peptidase PulO-like enzyme (type II secretory pathway)